jgi:hypothetical protein
MSAPMRMAMRRSGGKLGLLPSPLWGGVGGGGEASSHRMSLHVMSNIDGVLEDIASEITTTPTPNPSPQGGGEQTEFAA